MADESMVRTLAAQADAIWPQEEPLVRRYTATRILDVGCGTGEITSRLARMFPGATVVGVDIIEDHLELARKRYPELADRVTFQQGDAFALGFPDDSFDLVVCRHVLQAIPEAPKVLAELVRVGAPGGWLHVIAEDYDMIFSGPTRLDMGELWHRASREFARATGTDLHIGRNVYAMLAALPVEDIQVDYAHVDTTRVPRETIAAIFEAWRDGYVEPLAATLAMPEARVRAYFEALIECVRDPSGFALWLVPIVAAKLKG